VRPDIGSGVIVDVGGRGVTLGEKVFVGEEPGMAAVAVWLGSGGFSIPQADRMSRNMENFIRCLGGIRGIVPEAG
jgi:hypothetical protein